MPRVYVYMSAAHTSASDVGGLAYRRDFTIPAHHFLNITLRLLCCGAPSKFLVTSLWQPLRYFPTLLITSSVIMLKWSLSGVSLNLRLLFLLSLHLFLGLLMHLNVLRAFLVYLYLGLWYVGFPSVWPLWNFVGDGRYYNPTLLWFQTFLRI